MAGIKDIQKCYQIINKYGSEAQKEVMGKLRNITWYRDDMIPEAYETINSMLHDYMLKTANKLYLANKDDGNTHWFMKEDDDNYKE